MTRAERGRVARPTRLENATATVTPWPTPRIRRVGRTVLAGLLGLVVVVGGCSSGDQDAALPDATLVALGSEQETTTTELAPEGTPLVVNVWASWCVPCIEEMPAFDEVHRNVGDRVAIIGVTDDHADAAERLAEETAVTYPLYRDPDRTLLPDLGVVQLPATVFVGPDGTIVERHQGAMTADELQGTIDRLWDAS